MKPITSTKLKFSPKNIQAIVAVTAGIKKNSETVLLAELFLIKYIKIEKAPSDTRNTWWLIANKNSKLIIIKASSNIKKSIILQYG